MSTEEGRTGVVKNGSAGKKPGAREKPHDALFQKVFSNPALAAAELQANLPPDIVRQIRWALSQTSLSAIDFRVSSSSRNPCSMHWTPASIHMRIAASVLA